MHPDQTPPAPPPAPLPNGNQNPYDFIMNSAPPKKGLGSNLGGGSMGKRLAVVAVGGGILLLVIIIVFSLLFSGGSSSSAQLTDLAQQQTEIARIAEIGNTKASSTATKNLAGTTKLAMLSSQKQVVDLLAKSGHKLNPKTLALKQSATVDQQLDAAAANNAFDETFTKILTDQINAYRASVQTQFKTSTSSAEKEILQESFNGTTILISK